MTFTNLQAKAARALLECSIDTVSKGSGVNKDLISRFERGDGNLSEGNRIKLAGFYENNNIQFLEHQGVRFKPEGSLKELRGFSGFKEFMDDVCESISTIGGEIVVSNVDEKKFEKWQGEHAEDYLKRMSDIGERKKLNFRILVKEGDYYFTASEYAQYRWINKSNFGSVPFYVYGSKTAIILFKPDDVIIYIINNPDIAYAMRIQFNAMWSLGSAP